MPLPVIAGTVRASVAGQIDGGGRWSNTWHFRRADLGDSDLALVTVLDGVLVAFYDAAVVGNTTIGTTLDAADYTPLDGLSGAFHFSHSSAGTGSGNAMPAEVAECLTIRTGLRGRQNRGRIFLPAFSTGNFTADGLIAPAVISNVVGAVSAMQVALLLVGWELGVGSYGPYKDPVTGTLVTGTPHFTEAESFSMDNKADVQRSRKS